MIKKFNKFIVEKVQPGWFDKNPDFYLSRNVKDINKDKEMDKEYEKSEEEYISKLKKISVNDIEFEKVSKKHFGKLYVNYNIISPNFLNSDKFKLYNNRYGLSIYNQNEYHYKIYLAFIKYKNIWKYLRNKSIEFERVSKDVINPLFKELSEYYSLYYRDDYGPVLYLTKNKNDYTEKINLLKQEGKKIIYYNSKVKGKELTDFETIEVSKIRNQLKNITIDDIYFDSDIDNYDRKFFNVRFKDKELDSKIKKYKLVNTDFFTQEKDTRKVYFGHLKNRYHTRSISSEVKGIGLGYKIYKAFLKFNGYMVSDEQTSVDARKIYYNMLKDDDIYYVVDKDNKADSDKIMIMWKTYPKIKQLLRIVRTHELRNGRTYEYDKALLKDLKNIKG